jgi:hypothetical protein
MNENLKELKKFYYQNLFILKDINKMDEIEERVEGDKIAFLKSEDLRDVCNICKNCSQMSGPSFTEDLIKLSKKFNILPNIETNLINDTPIMFLLENPGRDYNEIKYFEKSIGNRSLNYWFSKKKELQKDIELQPKQMYSNTFAYIINKYQLKNVMITNTVKCKPLKDYGERFKNFEDTKRCMNNFLKKEIELFKPKVIICFGKKYTLSNLKFLINENKVLFENIKIEWVFHPASRKSKKDIFKRYEEVLNKIIIKTDTK